MQSMEIEDITEHLQQRGVKPTTIRIQVFHQLDKARRPLSLKDLEDRMLSADKSSIFRALTLLLQHHLVHGIEDGSGSLKYEICTGHEECTLEDQHAHFYCECCHRTMCLRDIKIPQVELPEGFHATLVNYMIKGICPDCARRLKEII